MKITFSVFSLLVLSTMMFSCQNENKTESNSPPNILYIMSDDHASHAISAYGSIYEDYFSTPNIDRLADEGMRFNNVFCTNAICGPSRAAILTGKYSHKNGYYKNESGGQFNSDQWTFPSALKSEGYQTALVGKWHLGSAPVGFDYFKYHDNPGQQGFYWDPVYNDNGTKVKEEGYATNLTADFALNWLEESRDKEKPFCLMLQFKAPHREWAPDTKYEKLWDDEELPYPKTFNDDYSSRESTAGDTDMTIDFFSRKDMKLVPPEELEGKEKRKWLLHGQKRGESWLPEEGMTQEEARKWKYQTYIKDYLACIKSVDDNIGRVLDYLDANGLAENTVVIYTSDQGFYLGEHGWFDKRFMYEESLRMPFIMRHPSSIDKGQINDDIITNVDFAPTILDYAGVSIPKDVQGRSFLKNTIGERQIDWPKSMYYHYYEFPFWHHAQPHYGLRNERYKLIHFYYSVDVWEFYDLENDPNELNNEIENSEYATIIQEMKVELKAKMKSYDNDISLEELRKITDKDFGMIN